MYPYITKNSILHYFDDQGILLGKKGRYMLNDVDVYILEKIDGKKSIDNIVEEISLEIGSKDKTKIENIVMKCINSKSQDILLNSSPKPQSCTKSGLKQKKVPLDLVVSLTNKCHLNCIHCFKSCNIKKHDSLDYEVLLRTLDFLKGKSINLQLTGGEPMLHKRFFDILTYAIENFRTTITTTGTMINNDNIKYFKGIKCIQISLYSDNADKHDEVTRTKGSFNNSLKGIKEAVKSDIFVSTATIVKKQNINNIENIIKLAINCGVRLIRFGSFVPCGRGIKFKNDWCLSDDEIKEVSYKLSVLSEKYKNNINIATWDEEKSKVKIDKKYESLNCGSGLYRWLISEKGFIKPCEFIPDEIFAIDNIAKNDIQKIIETCNLQHLAQSLLKWDKDLRKENCTIKDICPSMEEYCQRHCS